MAPKKNYSQDQMQKAIDCVNNGEKNIANAAKKYGVPRITLFNKITGKSPVVCSMGPATYLTKEEEAILETWIIHMFDSHIPVTKENLLDSVQRIITEKRIRTPFVDNRPGNKWYSLFLKRHPLISERTSQNLTSARDNVTEQDLRHWFNEIESYLREKNLLSVLEHPERVFNTHESAFYLSPKAGKVLAKKGEKHVYSSSGDEKDNLTVLVTGNAAGHLAPTMVVFSYERIPSAVANNFPSDWAIGRSDTGWMCGSTFYEYIANIFTPWLDENNIERPVLFFLDGHKSHLTLHLSDFCVANGIEIIALNPNSTHLMQPMDLAVFRPLKSSWRKAVNSWKLQNLGQTLKKEHFAPVLKSALDTLTPDSIKNGFRAGGLCPFGPDYIDMTKIKRSQRQETEDVAKKEFFSYLEAEISTVLSPQKLSKFRELYYTGRDDLEVPEQDLSLYVIWAKNYDATSNPQRSETHTQPAVTTQDSTTQSHMETAVQNELHPIHPYDFSDVIEYPVPSQSQPKIAAQNEPGTSQDPLDNTIGLVTQSEETALKELNPGTSENPLNVTAGPVTVIQSEMIARNVPKPGVFQDGCDIAAHSVISNFGTRVPRNENTVDTSLDSSNKSILPIAHCETIARNDPKPDEFRDPSDVTENPITYSTATTQKDPKPVTSGDPFDVSLGSVSVTQSETTAENGPKPGDFQNVCDITAGSVISNSETHIPCNENTRSISLDSSDKTKYSITHRETIASNDPKPNTFRDSSDLTASPVTYSKPTAHKDPKPGTSKDPFDATVGSGTYTEIITQNDPKPGRFRDPLDMTVGPVTSETTPKKKVIKGGLSVPSPFKRNLFWPDENESNKKKRRLKEKIPFAIGSPAWRAYHQNKEKEKQRKLVEKERRAEERKEKKKKMEELKNKKLKKKSKKQVYVPISSDDTDTEVKYAESDDSLYEEEMDEPLNETPTRTSTARNQRESKNIVKSRTAEVSSGSESDNEPLSRVSVKLNTMKIKNTQPKKKGISEGCHVIVKYEGEYFPGVVENVARNHYKVSTMTFSTGNTYRWPNKPDSIWYGEKDIVEKIQKPVMINKRGYYTVKEMEKFHTFTT